MRLFSGVPDTDFFGIWSLNSVSSIKSFVLSCFSGRAVLTVVHSRPRRCSWAPASGSLNFAALSSCGFLFASWIFRLHSGCVFPVWRIGVVLLCLSTSWLVVSSFKDTVLNSLVFLNGSDCAPGPITVCFLHFFSVCLFFLWPILVAFSCLEFCSYCCLE